MSNADVATTLRSSRLDARPRCGRGRRSRQGSCVSLAERLVSAGRRRRGAARRRRRRATIAAGQRPARAAEARAGRDAANRRRNRRAPVHSCGRRVDERVTLRWHVGRRAGTLDRHASAMKRTYQPKKRKRARTHGFRARMQTRAGRLTLKRRRAKGRKRLTSEVVTSCRARGRRPKRGRLSRSAEFERVYRQGRSHGNRHLVLYTFPRAGRRRADAAARGSASPCRARSAAPSSATGSSACCARPSTPRPRGSRRQRRRRRRAPRRARAGRARGAGGHAGRARRAGRPRRPGEPGGASMTARGAVRRRADPRATSAWSRRRCRAAALRAVVLGATPRRRSREFGILRGLVLAAWRLLRCNPFSHGGFDPVEAQRLFRPQPRHDHPITMSSRTSSSR